MTYKTKNQDYSEELNEKSRYSEELEEYEAGETSNNLFLNLTITSEDCVLPEMTGKFDLVFFASQRARAIVHGNRPLISGFKNAKNHSIIVALEEIRQGKLTFSDMIESLSSPHVEAKEPERMDVLARDANFDDDDDSDEFEDAKVLDYKSEEEYED